MKDGFALLLLGWLLVSVVFFGITVPVGGTAQNGKVENGHFFIGQHGKYREVSRTAYIASAVGTWVWAFYLFLVGMCGVVQPAGEKRLHWAVSLLIRLLGILLVFGFIAVMSYETLRCITSAKGTP
jgi:hypothetical protein